MFPVSAIQERINVQPVFGIRTEFLLAHSLACLLTHSAFALRWGPRLLGLDMTLLLGAVMRLTTVSLSASASSSSPSSLSLPLPLLLPLSRSGALPCGSIAGLLARICACGGKWLRLLVLLVDLSTKLTLSQSLSLSLLKRLTDATHCHPSPTHAHTLYAPLSFTLMNSPHLVVLILFLAATFQSKNNNFIDTQTNRMIDNRHTHIYLPKYIYIYVHLHIYLYMCISWMP